MPNYENSIIYKIQCKDNNIKDIYIGSTINFRVRKNAHKTACNNKNSKCYNFKLYECMRNNGGWENWEILEIEKVKCKDKKELHTKEREFIEKNKCSLNQCIPYRTQEEKDNYYENNKYTLRQKKKIYYEENKDIINIKKKIYSQNNRDKANNYTKLFYEKNKHSINEKRKIKIICECGCEVRKADISKHIKTEKHKNNIESLKN